VEDDLKGTGDEETSTMARDDFRLVILTRTLSDPAYEAAFPTLCAAEPADTLFVIGMKEMGAYDWDAQSITLTADGTDALLRVFDRRPELNDHIRTLSRPGTPCR
jgi:hypothetical protein